MWVSKNLWHLKDGNRWTETGNEQKEPTEDVSVNLPGKTSRSKIFDCQFRGSRFGQRHTECGGIWGSVLLLKLHLRYKMVCMDGIFVKRQDTVSTRQFPMSQRDVLTGPWDPETQHRDRQKPKALCQKRKTTVWRTWWRTLLPYSDGAGEIGRREDWVDPVLFQSHSGLTKAMRRGLWGKGSHSAIQSWGRLAPGKLGDQFCSPVISVPEKWKDKY